MTDELIERVINDLRLDAKAFRENPVYTMDGDPVRLVKNAERMDEAADTLASQARQIEALQKALVDHNDALRSACSVADRDGRETNWLSLRRHLHWALAEHRELTNSARATLEETNRG